MAQLDYHSAANAHYPVIICGVMYMVEGKRHVKLLLRHHGLSEAGWRSYRLQPLWFWSI